MHRLAVQRLLVLAGGEGEQFKRGRQRVRRRNFDLRHRHIGARTVLTLRMHVPLQDVVAPAVTALDHLERTHLLLRRGFFDHQSRLPVRVFFEDEFGRPSLLPHVVTGDDQDATADDFHGESGPLSNADIVFVNIDPEDRIL